MTIEQATLMAQVYPVILLTVMVEGGRASRAAGRVYAAFFDPIRGGVIFGCCAGLFFALAIVYGVWPPFKTGAPRDPADVFFTWYNITMPTLALVMTAIGLAIGEHKGKNVN